MRLLDTYATNTGSTIDKPYIYTKFFPVPEKKYITLQAQTPYDSRNYSYWQEVVDIIKPILDKENIEIVQVGIKDEIKIDKAIDYTGKTDINQLAFIIENSILHFGADSFCVHLASYFNKPIVSIYSISNPNVAGPHFGNKENHILIKAYENIGTKKPSYSQQESPKSINTIKPEEIANSILKLLKLKIDSDYKTLIIGDKFKTGVIEFVPDKILNPEFAQDKIIIMRLDLCENIDEQIIFQNLKIRKFVLMLNNKNKIQQQLLQFLKQNIVQVIFNCTNEKPDKKYIQSIVESGHVPYILYKGEDEAFFNEIKIDLIDFNLKIVHEVPNNKLIDELYKIDENAINKNDIFIKSNRLILSDGNIYLSEQHLLEKKPSTNHVDLLSKLTDFKKLDKEIDFLYIFTLKQNA
jgi:hypothetical protein